MVPSAVLPIILSQTYGDNKVLFGGLIVLFISCFIKINYSFDGTMPEVQYYAGSILFFASNLVSEVALISVLSKTISPKRKLGFWNAGLLGGSADTLGRAAGNALFTLYSLRQGRQAEPFYAYIIDASLLSILCVLVFIYLPKLRQHSEIHIREE